MLRSKIQDTLNNQLKCEFQSAYTYLSLAAYFEDLDLNGFAHWMKIQYHEELMHAEKIYTYINDRDGRVQLPALDSPTRRPARRPRSRLSRAMRGAPPNGEGKWGIRTPSPPLGHARPPLTAAASHCCQGCSGCEHRSDPSLLPEGRRHVDQGNGESRACA